MGRTIELRYQDSEKIEWELHTAHYSDSVQLKMLEGDGQSFLIAEDSTGYSAWNLQGKRVAAVSGIGDSGNKGESGTARDYMAHAALTKQKWARVLGLRAAENLKITAIHWQ
ncbi:hypothetical protein ACFSRY_10110 [Pontibacter locisalis]|uniref:Uncharacterized protein n=1 Tax=Pontibacter locisalis TaxID=1719035 RepID=A0ABW5IM62_9BACT